MSTVSLYDVAPRLAEARDVERWNIWLLGDDPQVEVGDRWAETVSFTHTTETCEHCGGVVDHYTILQRLLVGVNKGSVGRILSWRCRQCRASWSRHR